MSVILSIQGIKHVGSTVVSWLQQILMCHSVTSLERCGSDSSGMILA